MPDSETSRGTISEDSPARLEELADDELLAECHALPAHSPRRAAVSEVLVKRYGPLVRACVRPYSSSPEPVEDLMQVGYVGLLKAINNYDPAFGNGLRAYAVPCITGEIKRHFRDKRWQVRVQRPAQELLLEMRAGTDELAQRLGRAPDDADLADWLGVSPHEIQEARQAEQAFSAYSLDAPAFSGSDDPAELGELLGEEDAEVDRTVDMEAVTQHWGELPEREQRILVLRFYGNLTQAEIGTRLGISQMHVSRLLARALSHLRSRLTGPSRDRRRPA
jgi:RNA polymerase sigma-B factor